MSNRFGQAYGLTLMSPILGGMDERGVAHDIALREELRALNDSPETPLAAVPTTHLARWVVIDDACFEGTPAKVDHFASKYLLFTSNFDGGAKTDEQALGDYLDVMRSSIAGTLERLYRHCVGFPGVQSADAFRTYMKRCQFTTTFFFGAYPTARVDAVLRALDAQRRFSAFVLANQTNRAQPERLQQAFAAFMTELRSAPTPRPGTI